MGDKNPKNSGNKPKSKGQKKAAKVKKKSKKAAKVESNDQPRATCEKLTFQDVTLHIEEIL